MKKRILRRLISKNLKAGGNNLAGFTLIELVVVIFIFSLMATVSIPYLTAWTASLKIDGVQKELVSNIRLTQQKAVALQINHSIKFNSVYNSYDIIKKDDNSVVKTVILPQEISFSGINLNPSSSEIIFNPAAAPSANGNINLINNRGSIKRIEVLPSGFTKTD